MNRLGVILLLLFAAVVGGFFLLVRTGEPAEAPVPAPAAGGGDVLVPVAGVTPADLEDTWGDERGGGSRSHHAIDIVAPRGTPVVAAAGGMVEKLFESRDGGHTVYVRVDPATIHYYAHLDGYAADLREGVAVARGQRIATVGSTGSAAETAPHLHFEIKRMGAGETWWQGREVNPYPILAGR